MGCNNIMDSDLMCAGRKGTRIRNKNSIGLIKTQQAKAYYTFLITRAYPNIAHVLTTQWAPRKCEPYFGLMQKNTNTSLQESKARALLICTTK